MRNADFGMRNKLIADWRKKGTKAEGTELEAGDRVWGLGCNRFYERGRTWENYSALMAFAAWPMLSP